MKKNIIIIVLCVGIVISFFFGFHIKGILNSSAKSTDNGNTNGTSTTESKKKRLWEYTRQTIGTVHQEF